MTKEELIDEHRDINVDHDWWGCTYEYFDEICKLMGVVINRDGLSFSGFGSQGDGASFTGVFDGSVAEGAPESIRKHAPKDAVLHNIADELCNAGRTYFQCHVDIHRNNSPYVHSDTMGIVYVDSVYGDIDDWSDAVIEALESDILKLMRDLADWFYRALEQEYEYLTSDEVVWEALVSVGIAEEVQ